MTTMELGGLSSDQKINGVFEAFGYSIPVGKDGRRMWPRKFKQEMGKRMKAGTLSINEVMRECHISDKLVYSWRKQFADGKQSSSKSKRPKFSEVQIEGAPKQHRSIELSWRGVELKLDGDFPVESLAILVKQLGTTR
ncbi:MAG: transposase [Hyphomicrobiales bacterium]